MKIDFGILANAIPHIKIEIPVGSTMEEVIDKAKKDSVYGSAFKKILKEQRKLGFRIAIYTKDIPIPRIYTATLGDTLIEGDRGVLISLCIVDRTEQKDGVYTEKREGKYTLSQLRMMDDIERSTGQPYQGR